MSIEEENIGNEVGECEDDDEESKIVILNDENKVEMMTKLCVGRMFSVCDSRVYCNCNENVFKLNIHRNSQARQSSRRESKIRGPSSTRYGRARSGPGSMTSSPWRGIFSELTGGGLRHQRARGEHQHQFQYRWAQVLRGVD